MDVVDPLDSNSSNFNGKDAAGRMRTGVCTTGVRGSLVQIQSSRPINTGSDCQFFSHHDSHLIFRCQIIQLLEDINVNILRDRLEPVSSFGEPVAYSAPRKLAAGGVVSLPFDILRATRQDRISVTTVECLKYVFFTI